jgi:hypothetical protein
MARAFGWKQSMAEYAATHDRPIAARRGARQPAG